MPRGRKKKPPAQRRDADAGADAGRVSTAMGDLLADAGLSSLAASRARAKASSEAEPEPTTLPPPGPSTPSRLPSARPPASDPPRDEAPKERPRPVSPRSAADLAAWNQAYRGVRPLASAARADRRVRSATPAQVGPDPADPADAAARARLGALVAGGVRVHVERDEGFVRALREGADETVWKRLEGSGFSPEATLDLHGMDRERARRATLEFVRAQHRAGRRYLLLVVGKGHHSEDGVGVLQEVAIEALAHGGAAPLVHGFASAHARHGGRGAIALHLR